MGISISVILITRDHFSASATTHEFLKNPFEVLINVYAHVIQTIVAKK